MKGLLCIFFLLVCALGVFTSECPQVVEDPEIDILLPHETNCNQFYKCSHGQKVLQFCQPGLHFNVEKQYCDWPYSANCQTS
ncbi:hypothetical protein RN001_004461 [Aquatica leii]|uniref:Chitin-binding type-2 domain-containing protein n=1 Tax=Aquatica leii TaxID=1421715 RepID=A0AAN7PAQ5_9COLE|nr:hypothetical protein RN001_004461 [Aquatica leii]